ncbi:MAG: anion permease [Clostridia bacterium]|nr:anion permease [Clostridia bacterium]
MWMYLLLAAGLFMGWSLGTNDAANAFGTAVATRVVKYRTAIIIIAIMVMFGAVLMGHQNINKLASIATNNEVSASAEQVDAAIAAGTLNTLKLKSALKAAIIFACAGLTVFIMSYLKFPVSANQSVTGAVIGWGLCYADYSNAEIRGQNLAEILEFMSTWLINPLGAALISFVLVFLVKKFIEKWLTSMKYYDIIIKIGYIIAGGFSAYSIGQNSSASVTAFYYDATGKGANLIYGNEGFFTGARIAAIIGGLAIAVGVLTFSKRVMMTVGSSIAEISQVDGFVVIIASALTVVLMGNLMAIPVSTSQSVVGAVIGAGLVSGVKKVHFGVLKNVAIAWVSSPTVAGLLAWIVGICTKGYFGA